MDGQDESLAEFATRRLGREAAEQLVEPILSGIYSSDPQTQSLITTVSILPELEQHGSLLKGMLAQGRAQQRARSSAKKSGATMLPRSFTFTQGAQTMVHALQAQLHGDVRTNAAVLAVQPIGAPGQPRWRAILVDGTMVDADAVLMATQANVAARLLQDSAPTLAALLGKIKHDGIGSATFVYRQTDIATPLTGLMIPRRERRRIDAITVRAVPRAKAGHVLVRVFFGGADPAMLDLDDAGLHAVIQAELRELLGIAATPTLHSTHRWRACFPKPVVGHPELVAQIEGQLPVGLALAGNSYHGIGVPDVVHSAEQAVTKLLG